MMDGCDDDTSTRSSKSPLSIWNESGCRLRSIWRPDDGPGASNQRA